MQNQFLSESIYHVKGEEGGILEDISLALYKGVNRIITDILQIYYLLFSPLLDNCVYTVLLYTGKNVP